MRNDVVVVAAPVVAERSQVRYRGDSGARPQGVVANPQLLAADRVIVFPVAVFPPPASSTTAVAVTRAAGRAMAASHPGPALNPPGNPAARRPIAPAGKAKAQARARANNLIEAATGRKTPVHARVIGRTRAITGRRIEATPGLIGRKRGRTARITVRKAARTVPIRARTV